MAAEILGRQSLIVDKKEETRITGNRELNWLRSSMGDFGGEGVIECDEMLKWGVGKGCYIHLVDVMASLPNLTVGKNFSPRETCHNTTVKVIETLNS